jgi:hypothetical protein
MATADYLKSEYDELIERQGEQWQTIYERECKTAELHRRQSEVPQMDAQRKAIMTVFEQTMAALRGLETGAVAIDKILTLPK